jgi:hypothetical protein
VFLALNADVTVPSQVTGTGSNARSVSREQGGA